MTKKTDCIIGSDEDDVPFIWKLLFVGAVCTFSGAFLLSPTQSQIDEGIKDGVHWLQTSPRFADCGREPRKSCDFGPFSFSKHGSGEDVAFAISKDGRDVASIVGGKFYVESGLSDAERTRIRTAFAKVVSH
jgi:hypothetical protein